MLNDYYRTGLLVIVLALSSCSFFNQYDKADFSGLSLDKSTSILMNRLQKYNIQWIQYGNRTTLIVPTDKYFVFNTAKLNETCDAGLNTVIKLLNLYSKTPVYVAAFTDNVGSSYHKAKLSNARAETMLGYLWAHNISAARLRSQGYGDYFDVADNHLIHGSAMNRRIEIQWFNKTPTFDYLSINTK